MRNNPKILSTRILTNKQKEKLGNFILLEKDFISINHIKTNVISKYNNAIFTSQNAVKSIAYSETFKSKIKDVFCVGDKTAKLLQKLGKNVLEKDNYSEKLIEKIISHNPRGVDFYCGNIRMETIPYGLKNKGININEQIVYTTRINNIKIRDNIDAVMFFSPSAINSFLKNNNGANTIAFCIGKTTKNSTKNKFKQVVVSKTTTIESVIESVVKYFS